MNHRERKVVFNVLGRDIALRVQHDHEPVMHEIIGIVNERLATIRENLPTETDLTTMTLACIALAEELHYTKEQLASAQTKMVSDPATPTTASSKPVMTRRTKRRTQE